MCDLKNTDLPGLYQAADRASLDGQTHYLCATRIRLSLGIVAAGASLWSLNAWNLDVLASIAALAFLGAAGIELWLLVVKPEQKWYDGRAIAESSKTLAWRYAVAADPFPLELPDARAKFLDQLGKLLKDAPSTGISSTESPAVSDAIENLRSSELETRRTVYLRDRIEDQRDWYKKKSELNKKMACRWVCFLVGAEVFGFLAATGRAFGWYEVDAASLIAALMGAISAWVGVKQFRSLECAYVFANHELSIVHARLSRDMPEEKWASEAADAEEAISREHTMWRASRTTLGGING